MNVIDYFARVQIVNMISREDRREETREEFARHQFNIDTDKVSFFKAITPDAPEGFPNIGARGCFLSHLTILEDAIEKELPNILILEDDICFSKYMKDYGEQCIKELDAMDWDIVYFGHTFENQPAPLEWLALSEPTQLSHFYAVNGKAIARLAGCLREILSRPPGHPDGGPMHYDGALNTFIKQNPDLKTYYISSDLGYQRPSRTDIHENSIIDTNPVLKPITQLVRNLKKAYYRAVK